MPALHREDNVIPQAFEIPAMLNSLRHPRNRAISIGPQSAADAYEAMIYREKKRRENTSSSVLSESSSSPDNELMHGKRNLISLSSSDDSHTKGTMTYSQPDAPSSHDASLKFNSNEQRARDDQGVVTPHAVQVHRMNGTHEVGTVAETREDEKNDRDMFRKLQRPRVRYDVEVITKLIVYAGK